MDLAVRDDEVSLGIENERGVGELLATLALLGNRAADERDAVLARPPGHRVDRLALLERLGGGVEHLGVPDRVPLLGQNHDVRAHGGRPPEQSLGGLEVRGLVAAAGHLDAGDANAVGHGLRIALTPCPARAPFTGSRVTRRVRCGSAPGPDAPPRASRRCGERHNRRCWRVYAAGCAGMASTGKGLSLVNHGQSLHRVSVRVAFWQTNSPSTCLFFIG